MRAFRLERTTGLEPATPRLGSRSASRRRAPMPLPWAEFIEAGFLREYRLAKRVSLQRLRPFLERARTELHVPYPRAHFKPFVSNRELVYELQVESSLDPALFLVRREADQMIWAEPTWSFSSALTSRRIPISSRGCILWAAGDR
jgi:hypothetical protein